MKPLLRAVFLSVCHFIDYFIIIVAEEMIQTDEYDDDDDDVQLRYLKF